MRHLPLLLLLIATLIAPPAATPAAAQDPPACTDARAGAVACLAGKLCSCGYQRGGGMSGRPDGWRWDCGILRPACGEALPPAGIPSFPQPMPQLYLQLPPGEMNAPQLPHQTPPGMSPWLR